MSAEETRQVKAHLISAWDADGKFNGDRWVAILDEEGVYLSAPAQRVLFVELRERITKKRETFR